MNQYGRAAQNHWSYLAPRALAELEDLERFFTDLGLEIEGQITMLSRQLEENPALLPAPDHPEGDNYLREVARRMTARRIAEEVVMNQLAWVHDPSLPLDQAREEWEQTRAMDENLITWAERVQDSPDPMYSTTELEEKAKDWAVPVSFLQGLIAAEIPRSYAREHQALLDEAANLRFLREIR